LQDSTDTTDSIVADATRRIFVDLCDPQTVNAAPDDGWKIALWQALEESGLTLAWVPEEAGGVGASLTDAFAIARISGQFAVPVALGETLLAGMLLAKAGEEVGAGHMTVAPMRDDAALTIDAQGRVNGRARHVAYAASAKQIVVIGERDGRDVIAAVDPAECRITKRPIDLGGERADLTFEAAPTLFHAPAPDDFDAAAFRELGATFRAEQMTGALETMLHLASSYAQERVAFGRPIAKFQAVQHNLALLGTEVAAALTAAGSASETIANPPDDRKARYLEIASAKIRVGEAVERGSAIAHQVHGAIGFTAEHILQRFTRRSWGWRDDFGSESTWAVELGNQVIAAGGDALWPTLTKR